MITPTTLPGMTKDQVQLLPLGTKIRLTEVTSGESADGVERSYPVGTEGTIERHHNFGGDQGFAVTVVIGPTEGDEAIVNLFDEMDPIYPFELVSG